MSKPLTVANIRRAEPGDILRDADVPGLHLRVFPTKSVYYLHYRSPVERKPSGKPVERRLRLAPAEALSLPEIRARARSCLAEVAQGRDPAVTKRQNAAIPTISAFFELTYGTYWSSERFIRSGWTRQVRNFYDLHIHPRFGGRQITDEFNDLEEWHESFIKGKKPKPNTGNRALAVLSKLLNLSETKRYGRLRPLNSNPCSTIAKHPEPKRKVYASPEQISRIGPLLRKYAARYPRGVAFLYLLIYSGPRPSAIARAMPEQLTRMSIDGQVYGVLRLPGKNPDEPDEVWLPPQAMAVLDALPRTEGGTLLGTGPPKKLWHRIRKEAGCPELWMRDWRRTFATAGMSGGQQMAQISELLNHKTTQTTKIYAKLMDGAKQKAVGQIADGLEMLLTGTG